MTFVPAGGEQVRQLLAVIRVWRQQAGGGAIEVDTQTADEVGPAPQQPADLGRWVPPLDAEQWTGSLPSSAVPPDSSQGDPHEPTDDDLLQALEEFERQEQELGAVGNENREEAPLSGGADERLEHRLRDRGDKAEFKQDVATTVTCEEAFETQVATCVSSIYVMSPPTTDDHTDHDDNDQGPETTKETSKRQPGDQHQDLRILRERYFPPGTGAFAQDPRDDRWQWDVDKTRQFLDEEATMVDDIKKKKLTSRDDLGLPLPPTDLKLKAIAKIQRSNAAQASKQEAAKAEKEDKPKAPPAANKRRGRGGVTEEVDVDLGNVDVEFLNYKGLVMTKKQKAAFAARAAKAKKKQEFGKLSFALWQ
ncbi:hypothetical protein AK812_SmicGene6736 [Symbiodinium microadriaticum]|uniref:Uncharacterized protein n=1 Tax=Symbiodinium microadriaticum TaxID=2951 RepID=A0A1Q9EQG5_SYMMI|nr:hypothetical protein AK812_SmicGene6736 [Symbiodinium microadriaticum]